MGYNTTLSTTFSSSSNLYETFPPSFGPFLKLTDDNMKNHPGLSVNTARVNLIKKVIESIIDDYAKAHKTQVICNKLNEDNAMCMDGPVHFGRNFLLLHFYANPRKPHIQIHSFTVDDRNYGIIKDIQCSRSPEDVHCWGKNDKALYSVQHLKGSQLTEKYGEISSNDKNLPLLDMFNQRKVCESPSFFKRVITDIPTVSALAIAIGTTAFTITKLWENYQRASKNSKILQENHHTNKITFKKQADLDSFCKFTLPVITGLALYCSYTLLTNKWNFEDHRIESCVWK